MTPDERIIALERELVATRSAAVRMISGMLKGLATDPAAREEIAGSLEADASGEDAEMQRLARLVAAALRK